jgi:autotransporter passenger strand-loop-strand repeat protein
MFISSGGTANNTTVNSYGSMYISSGGVANSTTVNSGGYIFISSGGSATNLTLSAGGRLGVFSFAEDKYFTNISNCSAIVADNVYIIDSRMYIYSGGTANSTTVNSGGNMYISSGGTANNTTINSGGYMRISSGSIHRGSLQIENGATIAYSGAKIDFTVADRNTEDDYLINDLSLIFGTPTYTVTVDDQLVSGTYKLAQGASNFTGTITIGDGSVNYGSITVNGNDFVCNGQLIRLIRLTEISH